MRYAKLWIVGQPGNCIWTQKHFTNWSPSLHEILFVILGSLRFKMMSCSLKDFENGMQQLEWPEATKNGVLEVPWINSCKLQSQWRWNRKIQEVLYGSFTISLFHCFSCFWVSLHGFFNQFFLQCFEWDRVAGLCENSGRRGKFASVCIPRTVLITGLVEI